MGVAISALMTVYNGEPFIAEAIQSVLDQTFADFELIIVNDGSTDETVRIIRQFTDSRIRYMELDIRQGVGGAILEGLKIATGNYIAKVDADDIYHKERFAKQFAILQHHDEIGLVDGLFEYFPDNDVIRQSDRFTQLRLYGEAENNRIVESADISNYLYWFVCLVHSGVMFRRSLLKLSTYRPLKVGEDYDLFYRWNKQGVRMYKIPEVLCYVRVSDSSTTVAEKHSIIPLVLELKAAEIDRLFEQCKAVFIFGTGGLAQQVYGLLLERGKRISGFIDRDESKHGSTCMGQPVYGWEQFDTGASNGVLIAATPVKFELAAMLEAAGFKHLEQYIVIF
ncbi:glycosyltransferase [Paenibacillus sp. SGZ-1009]|uniref:glycosyltransferase n=1 Tax=Paenibacillus campi TaxID=3106031 RepID=UPI002AFF8703|nr:glycosyltransferase [Paenibacillus sp. SGZ-1009]